MKTALILLIVLLVGSNAPSPLEQFQQLRSLYHDRNDLRGLHSVLIAIQDHSIPVEEWNYKAQEDSIRHIGRWLKTFVQRLA